MNREPVGTFGLFIIGMTVLVAVDLISGLRTGRLRLPRADRSVSAPTFWSYAAIEAALVAIVVAFWLAS